MPRRDAPVDGTGEDSGGHPAYPPRHAYSDPVLPEPVSPAPVPGAGGLPEPQAFRSSRHVSPDPGAERPERPGADAPAAPFRSPVAVMAPEVPVGGREESGTGNRRGRPGPPPPPAPPVVPEGSGPRRRKPRKLAAFLLLTFATALILVAVGVAGYPFYTDVQAARHQKTLRAQFDQAGKQSAADRLKLLEQYKNRTLAIGSAVTRITIPKLGVETVVVEGTSDEALAAGAGHYPQSPLPGDAGNVAIAGHRTMNGHPFGDLDKLVPGDRVILTTPFSTYTYKIVPGFEGHANPWVTTPDDWTVVSVATQSHLLTLTTCNPKGQKTQRLIARAEMVSSQPIA